MNKFTEEIKCQLIQYYEEGKMDSEISKILGIQRATIQYWRKKLGLKTKFKYKNISKIKREDFEPLFYSGKSDAEIAKMLNVSYDGVYWFRRRNHYVPPRNRKFNEAVPLTDFQEQVLIGTMLGDSTMERRYRNANLVCAHCKEKEDYTKYKCEIFKSLNPSISYVKQFDKRTEKTYERCVMKLPSNPELNKYYDAFYTPKKSIPFDLLENFTEASLAFMFMDDGCGYGNYTVATNCFTEEELNRFIAFLYNKFGIVATVRKDHTIYITARSKDLFTHLISPYICDCMKYKLIK